MKVLTAREMSQMERRAYDKGYSEEAFMQSAGYGVALVTHRYVEKHHHIKKITLLCGKGNNAGDTYVAGVHLLKLGHSVTAFQVVPIETSTELCQRNHQLFVEAGGAVVSRESSASGFIFPSQGIIVDGLFGTGFHGAVQEPFASVIQQANATKLPIIAVDIPSGLNADTGKVESCAIKAAETAFLGLPKKGFFLQDGWNQVGKLRYVDFGLPQFCIADQAADLEMFWAELAHALIPPLVPNRHKYQAGYVVGVAGAPGMPGAALLSSLSALRGGAGIVRLLHPKGMEGELSAGPYELIKTAYQAGDTAGYSPEVVAEVIAQLNRASATFIGPAIGTSSQVGEFLRALLAGLTKPCVLDADALTLIAEHHISIPENAILTPHIGEMLRLLDLSSERATQVYGSLHSMEFLQKCFEFAAAHKVVLVLKGGPTFIMAAEEVIQVNPHGDPGMATAGSGDVLTGLIAALLAQGLKPFDAARLGVYLHSVAGERSAELLTSYCMLAGDIIHNFVYAFRETAQSPLYPGL